MVRTLATTPYDSFVPFSARVTKVTLMIDCDKLGDVDHFYLKNL